MIGIFLLSIFFSSISMIGETPTVWIEMVQRVVVQYSDNIYLVLFYGNTTFFFLSNNTIEKQDGIGSRRKGQSRNNTLVTI
jgi:hypothetical protein